MVAPAILNRTKSYDHGFVEGKSESALYGSYVTLWAELVCTGKIDNMERLMQRSKRIAKHQKNIEIALKQYRTMKMLHKTMAKTFRPSRSFARFVLFADRRYRTVDYSWVKIDFVRCACQTLMDQLRLLLPRSGDLSSLLFEFPVSSGTYNGRVDVYCPITKTVIEVKTSRHIVTKCAFAQLAIYAQILHAKKAFLLNTVDGSVFELINLG